MHKIIFGDLSSFSNHPAYLYLKSEACKEGWAGTNGLKGMVEERWGTNARLYFRDGDLYGIGFKKVEDYNIFVVASGVDNQLEMF